VDRVASATGTTPSTGATEVPGNSKELDERAEALKTPNVRSHWQNVHRSTKGTKVTKALVAPADNMMGKAAELKAEEDELEKTKDGEAKSDTKPPKWEDCDTEKPLAVVRKAIRGKASVDRIPIRLLSGNWKACGAGTRSGPQSWEMRQGALDFCPRRSGWKTALL